MKPERLSLYVALVAAWAALLGSLWFSEVRYLVPCKYCWLQRIVMYPLALIIPLGILARDRKLPVYTLAFSLIGLPLSTYHYLLQTTDLFTEATVCAGGASCTAIDWIAFGFVTIPFLALVAFAIILICSLVALNARRPLFDESEQLQDRSTWLPVLSVVGVALLLFGGSYANRPAPPQEITLPDLPDLPAAQPIYAANCVGCHGTRGEGAANSAPALTNSALLRDPERFATLVREGRTADDPENISGLPMPAFPDLSSDQLEALRLYLQALPQP